MPDHDDKNALVYLLAGFGLGCLVGAAAGILFAPKPGSELRGELGDKFKELKGKTEEWVAERRTRRSGIAAAEEVGA